jgi:hypothetical protein
MTSKLQIQIAQQRRAAHVISEYLLDRASRDSLPVLNWTIGDTGSQITGVSYTHPSAKRRDEITAWATALNIQLSEHADSTVTTITGLAEDVQTSFGPATIMLLCDVYHDEQQITRDQTERHYIVPAGRHPSD